MTKLCDSCGAKILDSTFQRTGGLCKPCWKYQRRKKIGETPFGIAYDTYFRQPPCLTEKYFNCWMELELTIAGPLFAARNDGDVSFVFKKSAIAGAKDFDDLMAWMNGQITGRPVDNEHNRTHEHAKQANANRALYDPRSG